MKDIYSKIIELFEKGEISVLATIIKQSGSTPRGAGTKFLILEDGSYVGTIGGGKLEAKVLEAAKEVFSTKKPIRLEFILKGKDVAASDMLCGGEADVFLEPVSPQGLNHLSIFKKVDEIQTRGGKGILATIINESRWESGKVPKMFIGEDEEKIGSLFSGNSIDDILLSESEKIFEERKPVIITSMDREGNEFEVFAEPMVSDPVLYIFGGGHVAIQLVPLAAWVGFRVVVIDDREEFADSEKFPKAEEVHKYPFEGVMDRLPINGTSYLVIVTRGHIHDRTVLTQSLGTKAKYIGMIGSRRKVSIVFNKLMEEGFDQKDLDRVFSPIGLSIEAETPEEIAVSIVAELIKVRAGMGD